MIIQPKIRGFICTTSHPDGCYEHVKQQIAYVKGNIRKNNHAPNNVLIIGASTGYGLASRLVSAFGYQAKTLGIIFEKPASGKRTASAGWYNTVAFEYLAQKENLDYHTINGDAFSNEVKQQVIDYVKSYWGKIDMIIYSIAAPKRLDPKTQEVYSSVLKPIGQTYKNKTIDVISGKVSEVEILPATMKEIIHTVKVMGGEDWELWINKLDEAGILATGVITIAYSYIGPELTYPIYRNGTIGRAKADLEQKAHELDTRLQNKYQGHAFISVNKGIVTQASAAIPVVPLYISLLYQVMKKYQCHEGCIEQITRLFNQFLSQDCVPVDSDKRIRIDDLEMSDSVQSEVEAFWPQLNSCNIKEIADLKGYREEFYRLFGFGIDHIDYQKDTKVERNILSIKN